MLPTVYTKDASPCCRAVLLTAAALGLELNQKKLDFNKNEQNSPEFVKINPQHTVPTLDDDGVVITESHAINTYLASKYGKDDTLYPKDLPLRALVDQRLHFDTGVLFARLLNAVRPVLNQGQTKVPELPKQEVLEAYDFLNKFLDGNQYVAGNQLTIADFSLVTTATSIGQVIPIDPEEYPNVVAWINRLAELPYYSEIQDKGLQEFKVMVTSLLSE